MRCRLLPSRPLRADNGDGEILLVIMGTQHTRKYFINRTIELEM